MALGESAPIYIADGSVAGIRHTEVVNGTGHAIACVVHGSVRNGREVWKDDRRRRLKEIDEASSTRLEDGYKNATTPGAAQQP